MTWNLLLGGVLWLALAAQPATGENSGGYLAVAKRLAGERASLTLLKLSPDVRSYEELWSTADVNAISQVVILDGKLFAHGKMPVTETDRRGKPRSRSVLARVCYDVRTGKLLKADPCMDTGSVVAADGMVYIVEGGERHCDTPQMHLLKPTADGFEHVSTFNPVVGTKELWVSPTIAPETTGISLG